MDELKTTSARDRLIEALYELLRDKPFSKIKVTELVALTQINRGTFYKYYESVPDLFQKAQSRLCNALLTLSVPAPKRPAQLREFTTKLVTTFLEEYETQVRLIGGENGDVRSFWLIGTAIQTRLQREANAIGADDDGIRRNISAAPGFFAAFLCQNVYQKRLLRIWPTLTPFAYRNDKTFFENAAIQLQQRRGGSVQFHYDLILSYVKFYDSFEPLISVKKLLETAGINRTEFYLYYRNFKDFHQAYIDVLYASASLYCRDVCCAPAKQAAELIAVYSEMNYGFVQRTLQGTMERGEIIYYVTTLIGSVYTLLTKQFPLFPDSAQTVRLQLLYEIGSAISYALTFYAGLIDRSELESNLLRLDDLRRRLGIGGAVDG